jgi:hypothetical protein
VGTSSRPTAASCALCSIVARMSEATSGKGRDAGPGFRVRSSGLRKTVIDMVSHTAATSRRGASEALHLFPARRGRGERRMPNAPAASCAIVVVERTRVTTSTPESPDVPARNGFNGFLRALPGDRAFLPPSPAEYAACPRPVGPTHHSANLTPASGRQDHTTSPYAATSLVRVLGDRSQAEARPAIPLHAKRCRVHRIPPRVRDDGQRPSCGVGWREFVEMICPTGEAKYFCKRG